VIEKILEAVKFAVLAHKGQVRKYTGEPYVMHCLEVAQIVEPFANDDMICAALLHDTIEDCGVTRNEIADKFGDRVAELVWWITDQSKPEDGNRVARKAIDRAHIAKAPFDAQAIKLADLISNTSSIVAHDPDFAKVYLAEKKLLLDVMIGPSELWHQAYNLAHGL